MNKVQADKILYVTDKLTILLVICLCIFIFWQLFNKVELNHQVIFGFGIPISLFALIKALITHEGTFQGLYEPVTKEEAPLMYWGVITCLVLLFLLCLVVVFVPPGYLSTGYNK